MAVISVSRELRDKLGDAATDSLVDLLHQFGSDQREDLITVVEERFARHLADTRDTLRGETHAGLDALRSELHAGLDALRSEMHAGFVDVQKQFLEQQQQIANVRADLGKEIGGVRADLGKEIGGVRADLGREIADVRKEIGDVRKEITVQTRWLLTVLVAATILIPVMQRVLAALFP